MLRHVIAHNGPVILHEMRGHFDLVLKSASRVPPSHEHSPYSALQLLMLIGTADVLKEPAEMVTFVEDLAPEEMQGLVAAGVPMGLENLGNTCYMNATLQVSEQEDDARGDA